MYPSCAHPRGIDQLWSEDVKVQFWRRWLPCLVILIAVCGMAQDSGDDDSPGFDNGSTAQLWLNFDRQGNVNARLNLPEGLESSDQLPKLLAESLRCQPSAFKRPGGYPPTSLPKSWSPAQRERYQKQIEEFNQRQLAGSCQSVLARQEGVLQGDFDYSSLATELRRIGVRQLALYVDTPQTQFRDYPKANRIEEPVPESNTLAYQIPLPENGKLPVFHLAYGFRRGDLNRAFAILAGFVLLPVLVTVWMRRKALATAKEDAAAAWFGFFRTQNWLVTGAMLFWLTSGFGARQALQDWVGLQGFSAWKAAAANVTVMIGPALLIYFLCIALSYSVHAQLRGMQWTRWEFLSRQMVSVGAKFIPLMLGLAALELLNEQLELGIGLVVVSLVLLQALLILRLRIVKDAPQPLTTGELRDKVFAMAGRLGVTLSQIFVLPAGKGQVANAYAAKNRVVMFTDYLLEHLSKREVDAVAAHELAHLRHKHPTKRLIAFFAAMFSPFYFKSVSSLLAAMFILPLEFLPSHAAGAKGMLSVWRGMRAFEQFSQRDFVLVMVGLTVFYFISRHFENVADATAVQLTGDPEALITGLLRVSRLNFTPIQWGKLSESWLTHPSLARRAERIAEAGGMAPERLQEILVRYNAGAVQREAAMPAVAPEDHYPVPEAGDPELVRSVVKQRVLTQVRVWTNFALSVLLPTLVSLIVVHLHLEGYVAVAGYAAGIVITVAVVVFSGVWMARAGYAGEKARVLRRLERDHLHFPLGNAGDIFIGWAPTAYPRIFGNFYHWDSGFLILSRDRLQFVGEKTRFSLAASEIDGIVLGPGGPGWWKFQRIYLRWKVGDGGRSGVFNFYSLEPGSVWRAGERVRALYHRLQSWKENSQSYPEIRTELGDLPSPAVGEVTCMSPRVLGTLRVNLRFLTYLLPLAIVSGMLLHAETWYLCFCVILLRLFMSVPYWRYRDRFPAFPASSGTSSMNGKAATAGSPANLNL
jgi:Zn-dependent protease with chaperone function